MDDDIRVENTGKKKPFNKRKWREQKYSKQKKIEQWQERRKKAALHKYHKLLKKENLVDNSGSRPKEGERYRKLNKYQQALKEYERICREREEEKQKALQVKAAKEAARAQSHALRAERNRKLARKTARGQPIMKERLELMFEKIKSMQ